MVGVLAVLAACGNTTTPPRNVPATGSTATPTPAPTSTPLPSSETVITSTTASSPLGEIGESGTTFTGSLPAASVVTQVTVTISATPPSGDPALSGPRASLGSARGALHAARTPALETLTALAYLTLEANAAVTFDGIPAFSFTLPQIVSGDQYYLAVYQDGGWVPGADGPATVSGDSVTFPAMSTPDATLAANTPVTFALYATPAASATPTPTPTATPTPTPVATPVAAPTSIAFDLNAMPTPAPLTVSETGYAGSFFSAIACTQSPAGQTPASLPFVGEISPASGTTFIVTPGNETGSCTVTITDANSASITVPVTVSATNVGVFGTQRKK